MAITILTETDLDVTCKQRELVQEALGPDGVYIRMKETLLELAEKGGLKDTQKAELISTTVSSMVNSITSASMSTALQWAAQEKDLALKKLQLEYELANTGLENEILEYKKEESLANVQLLQAKRIRDYGIAVFDNDGNVVSLGDNGRLYEEEKAVKQDTLNKVDLNTQIKSQTEEVQARTHKIVADTYVNHGIYTWSTISDTGITGVQKTAIGYVTLSDLNKEVAKEQAKGYAWNAWSNSASASAGMIGTLIAAEIPELVDDAQAALENWTNATVKLNNIQEPTISI